MELRDSGRDLVQINDDGTHAILPVTSRTIVQPDHVRLPVMWLRHSDGKLRRDGSNAACWQPNQPVDERGRLHGAPGLAVIVKLRVVARIRGPCRNRGGERQWVRERKKLDRLRQQDKSSKVCCGRSCDSAETYRNFSGISAPCKNWVLLCAQHVSTMCERRGSIWSRRAVGSSKALLDQPTPVKARALRARLRRLTALTSAGRPGVCRPCADGSARAICRSRCDEQICAVLWIESALREAPWLIKNLG